MLDLDNLFGRKVRNLEERGYLLEGLRLSAEGAWLSSRGAPLFNGGALLSVGEAWLSAGRRCLPEGEVLLYKKEHCYPWRVVLMATA